MKRLIWKLGLTLIGIAMVAGAVWLHQRSQERFDYFWLGFGNRAWEATSQNGCLVIGSSLVKLDQIIGHDSQIIGEMKAVTAWAADFQKSPGGASGWISIPLWLAAAMGLLVVALPWLPHHE